MSHSINHLRTILGNLKILGYFKATLTEESVSLWSDALEDLSDEQLTAGYNQVKKKGIDGGLTTVSFIDVCKQSSFQRPEYRIPESNQIEDSQGISAREWTQRLIKREVVIFNNLPEPERTENYKKHLRVISKHSHWFQSLQADAHKRSNKLEAMLDKVGAYPKEQQEQHKERIDQLTKAYTDSLIELEALAT